MDRSSSLSSRTSFSSGLHLSQEKLLGKGTERSLESVLHASEEKVSAIESMLRGLELFDRHNSPTLRSSSLDIGVDPPLSHGPPFPAAVPVSNHLSNSLMTDPTSSSKKGCNRNGGLVLSDIIMKIHASKDPAKSSYRSNLSAEALPTVSSYNIKKASERIHEMRFIEENTDCREARQTMNHQADRH